MTAKFEDIVTLSREFYTKKTKKYEKKKTKTQIQSESKQPQTKNPPTQNTKMTKKDDLKALAAVNAAPSSIGTGSHRATLKVLWQKEDLNLFKEELSDHFEQERSKTGTISSEMVRKGEKALDQMLEYHSLLEHMHEIERYQIEEIDQLKEMVIESVGKVGVLSGIRKTLEGEVAVLQKFDGICFFFWFFFGCLGGFRIFRFFFIFSDIFRIFSELFQKFHHFLFPWGELRTAQDGNSERKNLLETRDNQLLEAGEKSKEAKEKFEEKKLEQAAAKDEVMAEITVQTSEIQESNTKMATAVGKAESSTKQLKMALNECSDTLKDVTETEYEKGHRAVVEEK